MVADVALMLVVRIGVQTLVVDGRSGMALRRESI